MKYVVPLSREDAETIAHAAECRILVAGEANSTLDDAARYGEARMWLTTLMRGESVEIDEAVLAESRTVIEK